MRDRHFPRLCRSCDAPMARQEDKCWRCGADWDSKNTSEATLRVIPGGASEDVDQAPEPEAPEPATAVAAAQ